MRLVINVEMIQVQVSNLRRESKNENQHIYQNRGQGAKIPRWTRCIHVIVKALFV